MFIFSGRGGTGKSPAPVPAVLGGSAEPDDFWLGFGKYRISGAGTGGFVK